MKKKSRKEKRLTVIVNFDEELSKRDFYKIYKLLESDGIEIRNVVFKGKSDVWKHDNFVVRTDAKHFKNFTGHMLRRFGEKDWNWSIAE